MMSSNEPIFIVGAPRSGTTLLRSMLDAHPNICCPTWETGLFDRLGLFVSGDFEKGGEGTNNEANFCPISRIEIIEWMRKCTNDMMNLLTSQTAKPRWGEKTPAHVFHMELIHEVFPHAQFIHILRNGRDVVKSLQNVAWSPRNIHWSVQRWAKSVVAGRAAGAKLGAEQYVEIRYEDLTREPETSVRRLCEYLHEPFAPQMLEFGRPENNSWGLKMDNLQPQSVNRNRYRELTFLERLVVRKGAGRLLKELGYK